ncbi:MAG TPA: hypothetical protein VFY80_07455 [Burkholderiales bacterium]|nr:hypothetical protein [Burkholderiales bacterium]
MKAVELGELLESLGVPILGYRENDGYLGASVRVTDNVHIEIAEEGAISVVAHNARGLQLYAARTEVNELICDLVEAGALVLH